MYNNFLDKQMIIGGKFGLPQELNNQKQNPDFLSGNPILLFNARSGIRLIVDFLKPKQVWLPSYLCPTIVEAANNGNCSIRFYPIDNRLKVSSKNFIKEIKPRDLFLFIEYFGFPFEENIFNEVKSKRPITIKDNSQSLFSKKTNETDFCLYSPRKFLGVPDGGILHVNNEFEMVRKKLQKPPFEIFFKLFSATIQRRDFDLFNNRKNWFNLFIQGEKEFTTTPYSMSEYSQVLLRFAFNYSEICNTRIENFKFLANHLRKIGIFLDLHEHVVPLGFPILIDNRNKIQELFFEKGVFPPIHWKIEGSVPSQFTESHVLSQQILTIPCDQRYNLDDMNRIVEIIKKSTALL